MRNKIRQVDKKSSLTYGVGRNNKKAQDKQETIRKMDRGMTF
jgi:hypothetical protein